jgi:hypothetical protein
MNKKMKRIIRAALSELPESYGSGFRVQGLGFRVSEVPDSYANAQCYDVCAVWVSVYLSTRGGWF